MKTVMERLREHYDEALEYFSEGQIVGIFLQGSQNYGLDLPTSDVDTKLIVVPSFKDIAMNKKPVSTTHIRENEEHIDFKDIRLYMQTFRKQNLNFLEILFTPYKIVNPMYQEQWDRLIEAREAIAHMNPYRAAQSMKGIAMEKYHAMEHSYPSKLEILAKHGYDPKQLHHLLRVEDYLERYISGETYEQCLRPTNLAYLISVKQGIFKLEAARILATAAKEHIEKMAQEVYDTWTSKEDEQTSDLLDDVQYEIMRIAVERELR